MVHDLMSTLILKLNSDSVDEIINNKLELLIAYTWDYNRCKIGVNECSRD